MRAAGFPWRQSAAPTPRAVKLRLTVELLEDRTLLSAASSVQVIDSSSTDYDPSSLLVRFRTDLSAPVNGADILPGSQVGEASAPLLVPGLHLVHLPAGVSVPQAIVAYQASPLVLTAEPNFHIYLTDTIPNDPRWSSQSDMRRIQTPAAWDYWVGSGSTIVADIDTGIDYNHVDLAGNLWPYTGFNFVNNTWNPLDDNGHGTHTAGTIGAIGNNGIGVAGVNWYVQIMALKVFNASGQGNLSWAISALNFAVQNGAVVSNNSYGCQSCFTSAFLTALQNANAFGHVFVAAAGNNNANNDVTPFYPASYNVGNVISVAATNSTSDTRASFSNYGVNTVHLGAPGVSITSTVRNNGYGVMSGTSMAAPHVTGAMALMIDYWGLWGSPSDMRDWLMYTTDPAGLPVQSGGRLNVARLIGAISGPGGAPGSYTPPIASDLSSVIPALTVPMTLPGVDTSQTERLADVAPTVPAAETRLPLPATTDDIFATTGRAEAGGSPLSWVAAEDLSLLIAPW